MFTLYYVLPQLFVSWFALLSVAVFVIICFCVVVFLTRRKNVLKSLSFGDKLLPDLSLFSLSLSLSLVVCLSVSLSVLSLSLPPSLSPQSRLPSLPPSLPPFLSPPLNPPSLSLSTALFLPSGEFLKAKPCVA